MKPSSESNFNNNHQTHPKGLNPSALTQGPQPKTIDVYARTIRRIGAYFDYPFDDPFEPRLTY